MYDFHVGEQNVDLKNTSHYKPCFGLFQARLAELREYEEVYLKETETLEAVERRLKVLVRAGMLGTSSAVLFAMICFRFMLKNTLSHSSSFSKCS